MSLFYRLFLLTLLLGTPVASLAQEPAPSLSQTSNEPTDTVLAETPRWTQDNARPALFTFGDSCGGCGRCQKCTHPGPVVTVYGFGQADWIQDFNRVDPLWEGTLRPSRIPTQDGQFGSDGNATVSARQSRLGVDGSIPTSCGSITTKFEFDMYGVGVDEGQTTFRLRHAYGEWGNWLGGQTHSLFMDIDVFPNTIDYWGPAGMVFLRTPQIRWQPIRGTHNLAISVEAPDTGIDVGEADRILGQFPDVNVAPVERFADIAARYRRVFNEHGTYLQFAGILRPIGFETLGVPGTPGEDFAGWGINLSGNYYLNARNRLIGQIVHGRGIASYMNDGGVDIAPRNAVAPFDPALQPLTGIVLYYDHHWNECLSSAIGYSTTYVDNFEGQTDDAFRQGQYVSTNLLYTPIDNVLIGIEYLWGSREDNDGARGQANRMQVSFKYSF